MTDHPDAFRFDLGVGRVVTVYPESWEVDLDAEVGGVVERALVIGQRLPEVSSADRPQWCVFGFASHQHGGAVCWPVESRLPGQRMSRADLVEYDEILNWRFTIDRSGNLELRNAKGDQLLQLRIQENGGVIRLDTPSTRIVMREEDASIELHCDKSLTATCKDATVTADTDATVNAGGQITVKAPTLVVDCAKSTFKGDVDIEGNLAMVVPS